MIKVKAAMDQYMEGLQSLKILDLVRHFLGPSLLLIIRGLQLVSV